MIKWLRVQVAKLTLYFEGYCVRHYTERAWLGEGFTGYWGCSVCDQEKRTLEIRRIREAEKNKKENVAKAISVLKGRNNDR